MARLTKTMTKAPVAKDGGAATLHHQTEERLRKYLTGGRVAIGDKLPAEMELCKKLNVSRNTLRISLARLEREGFLLRKKRVGTVVISTTPPMRYTLDLSSLETLRDYVRRTEFGDRVTRMALMPKELQALSGVKTDKKWTHISGIRRELTGKKPLAGMDIYIDQRFADDADAYGASSSYLYEVIGKRHGESIARIAANIIPIPMPRRWAADLGEAAGTPTLGLIEVVRNSEGLPLEILSVVYAPSVQISFAFVPENLKR